MPYLGPGIDNGYRSRFIYTATAGQTSFSGGDSQGITLTYTDSEYLDVYQNGVLLVPGDDYAATTGTTVVLVQGASLNDKVEMIQYQAFGVADTVSRADGGAFGGNISTSGTLAVTGASTLTGNTTVGGTLGVTGASTLTGALSAKGGVVFNEDSADVDFRVESNDSANALVVNGGTNRVGIGTDSPDHAIHVVASTDGTGVSGDDSFVAHFQNLEATADKSFGVKISAGSTGTDQALTIVDHDGTNSLYSMTGAGTSSQVANKASVYAMNVYHAGDNSNRYGIAIRTGSNDGGGTNYSIGFQRGAGNAVGSITHSGGSTSFNTSSDYRLKENVDYTFDATTRLKQLKPARFNFIGFSNTVDGFLAHEVSSVIPEAVVGAKDAVDADDNIEPQAIDQSKLVPLLVKTLQEALTEIDTLKTKVAALESA